MKFLRILIIVLVLILPLKSFAQDIFTAAKDGDLVKIKELVLSNADLVKAKDEHGRTPVHRACGGVHLDVIKFLLDKGADIDAKNNNGFTPLHYAAYMGNTKLAGFLVDKGAELNSLNNEEFTPLHYAAYLGNPEAAEYLVNAGADIKIKNKYKRTPFLIAVRACGITSFRPNRDNGNYIRIIKFLIDKGADIHLRDFVGESAMSTAIYNAYEELVDLLISKGAEVPSAGEEGKKMIHAAAGRGLGKIVNLMLEKGIDIKTVNESGETLLHTAAKGGLTEIIKKAVNSGLDINGENIYSHLPLHYAASSGNVKVVELLLEKGAGINRKTRSGKTALYLAKENGKQEIVDLLVSKGADLSEYKFPILTGEYLGQKKPGKKAELFAPDIVSTEKTQHSAPVFSPDGKEVYWTSYADNLQGFGVKTMKYENNRWTAPEFASFSEKYMSNNATASYDGNRIFFFSRRPLQEGQDQVGGIFFCDRTADGWSEAKYMSSKINSKISGWSVYPVKSGAVYFSSTVSGGFGRDDIYRSDFVNGEFGEPVNAGNHVNTESDDGGFIAPDESYMILNYRDRDDGFGDPDLYVIFKKNDGTWTKPKNLGGDVNNGSIQTFPHVSPDGKYLFYVSFEKGSPNVFWADAKVFLDLKPDYIK